MTVPEHDVTIQRQFTEIIIGTGIENASRHHKIYNRLLYHRFEEIIDNAFYRLKALMDKHEWKALITGFIQHGAKTPYIWQLPDEFRRYAAHKISLPFAKEMLWFEWIEIELMMQRPAERRTKKLPWDRAAALSPTARIKRLAYPVYDKADDSQLETKRGEYPVLVYLEMDTDRVMYQPITPFMYAVLKKLKKGAAPKNAVKEVAGAYGENPGDVAAIIRPVLEQFYMAGILASQKK